jgi:hypothetical protein
MRSLALFAASIPAVSSCDLLSVRRKEGLEKLIGKNVWEADALQLTVRMDYKPEEGSGNYPNGVITPNSKQKTVFPKTGKIREAQDAHKETCGCNWSLRFYIFNFDGGKKCD